MVLVQHLQVLQEQMVQIRYLALMQLLLLVEAVVVLYLAALEMGLAAVLEAVQQPIREHYLLVALELLVKVMLVAQIQILLLATVAVVAVVLVQ